MVMEKSIKGVILDWVEKRMEEYQEKGVGVVEGMTKIIEEVSSACAIVIVTAVKIVVPEGKRREAAMRLAGVVSKMVESILGDVEREDREEVGNV